MSVSVDRVACAQAVLRVGLCWPAIVQHFRHARCLELASVHESEVLHDNDCVVENLPALHRVQKDEIKDKIWPASQPTQPPQREYVAASAAPVES